MQQEYIKTYEAIRHTGRTVKLSTDVWEHIKNYLSQNFDAQEIAVHLPDDNEVKLEDMDEAFSLIAVRKDDIKKIEIKAEKDGLRTYIRFINKKEPFDEAFYISISSENKIDRKHGRIFANDLMKKSRLFAKAEVLPFLALVMSVFWLLNIIVSDLELSFIGELSTIFFSFLLFSYVNQSMTNLLKYKKGVQFWVDKYDVSEYTRLNKKRRIFMWMALLLAVVICAAAIFLTIGK